RGADMHSEQKVVPIEHSDGGAHTVTAVDREGVEHTYPCTHVISSMPFGALLRAMDPPVPAEVLAASDGLTYREHMTVALVVPMEFSFPDNWIYIHDPGVKVG